MASLPNGKRRLIITGFLLALALLLFVTTGEHRLTASVFDGAGLLGGLQAARGELGGSGIRSDINIFFVVVHVINTALNYAALAAVAAFVVAGFFFILGFGSDAAIQRAKKIMTWSAVGLVVILFAITITGFIIKVVT